MRIGARAKLGDANIDSVILIYARLVLECVTRPVVLLEIKAHQRVCRVAAVVGEVCIARVPGEAHAQRSLVQHIIVGSIVTAVE
jgi:predicted transcriptional regulator